MRTCLTLVVLSVAASWFAARAGLCQEHGKHHSPAEMNRQFSKPDLDVAEFIRRFESDSRDIFVARRQIVDAVGLRQGMAVADIGAGTGLFTFSFAEQVGPKGQAYAVEIAPAFLSYIEKQARERRLENIKAVRASQDSTNLAANSIDLAFVCATYHHFEHPKNVLASIHRALRREGRLVVIDFDLRKDSSAFVREHARGPKEVYFREISAAGFRPLESKAQVGLKDNFFAVFERKEPEGSSASGQGGK